MGWLILAVIVLAALGHGHQVHRNYYRRGLSFKASWWGPLGIHMTRWFNL
jgi:hypothetical protein